jgi:hypothetical protein
MLKKMSFARRKDFNKSIYVTSALIGAYTSQFAMASTLFLILGAVTVSMLCVLVIYTLIRLFHGAKFQIRTFFIAATCFIGGIYVAGSLERHFFVTSRVEFEYRKETFFTDLSKINVKTHKYKTWSSINSNVFPYRIFIFDENNLTTDGMTSHPSYDCPMQLYRLQQHFYAAHLFCND